MVTGQDVANFLGQSGSAVVALAGEHVAVVTAMARAYTRDRGFDPITGEPFEDVAAVITTATARLVANPEQIAHATGPFSYGGGFTGWSLAETFVLNRYRKRAQ